MDFREFCISISDFASVSKDLHKQYYSLNSSEISKLEESELKSLFIEETWVSGGITGGNCWAQGPQEHYPVSVEKPGSLNEPLLSIIKHFCPELSAVDFFEKVVPLIQYTEFSKSEYYGNYYDYTRVYVELEDLFNVFQAVKNN